MVSIAVSRMGKTCAIFIDLGAKVSSSYYCEVWTCSWWRIVAWYQSQVSSVQMDSPAGWCTTALCEKHAWVVQQQGGHIEPKTRPMWISNSKCRNYSNSVNIWCFAVYMTLYWRIVGKGVTFLAQPVHTNIYRPTSSQSSLGGWKVYLMSKSY